jgi:hypothetical protein
MRISARVVFQLALLPAVAAGLLVPGASAGQVSITFGGSVTGPGKAASLPTNVAVGEAISGYFTYTYPASGSSGSYSFAGTGQTLLFSIPILNNTATFSDQNSNVSPNEYTITIKDTGSKGATFDLFVDEINTYGKPSGATLDLLFTSSTYTGLALPSSSAAFTAAFAFTNGKFQWDPGGEGIGGNLNVINGQTVPEPSSLILVVMAMVTCAAASASIARRKAAATLGRERAAQPTHC